ncbi:MAG: PAS domain S-box protein [Usitatibacteraceae bacterium]
MNSKRQAEEALRASEERFRTLTEISSDWFWETDTEHRFTFLSLDVSLDKRTTRADVLGKTRWELFPNMMTPAEWEVHHETLAARRPFQEVLTRAFNEAETEVIAYFNISGLPKYDATGKFTGYRGVGRDVTRIKRAEQAIADSEAKFRLITQNMRDIIALLAPDGKTLYLSPSFTRVTGHGADTSLRENPESLFHPDDFLRAKEAFTRCVLGDGKETARSYRFRHADGHYLWFENQMRRSARAISLPASWPNRLLLENQKN